MQPEMMYKFRKCRENRAGVCIPKFSKIFSFCLSVCVPVMILNDIVCVHDFTMKPLEYKNDFDTVGDGKVCSCAPF